jgi:membrane fusion protein (multidrug efflux system)
MQSQAIAAQRAALALLSAAALAACGPGGPPGGHGGMPPAVVAVQEVQPRVVPVEFEYPAQTAGSREAEVRPRVGGILLKRHYEEGATVREGQSLFQIDPAPYEAAQARAEADVSSAEVRFNNATRNAKRMKPLFDAKAASQKDYDDAVSAEEVAAADLKSARARLVEAKLNTGYTHVYAPVSGVTSRSLKSEGTLLAGPQDLLTTVTTVDPVYVNFGMSEAEQLRFRKEMQAKKLVLPKDNRFEVAIKFEDGTMYQRIGRLAFTDVRVNTSTGTSDARAELPNPAGEVRPGQFVRAILKGAQRPDAITVPQRAVMESPQGKMVYIFTPGKNPNENVAMPRPVTVGDWTGTDWIITEGLKPGDKVIVDGLAKIFFPGAPVMLGDPNAPPPGMGGPGGPPGNADAKGGEAKGGDAKKGH